MTAPPVAKVATPLSCTGRVALRTALEASLGGSALVEEAAAARVEAARKAEEERKMAEFMAGLPSPDKTAPKQPSVSPSPFDLEPAAAERSQEAAAADARAMEDTESEEDEAFACVPLAEPLLGAILPS